ncbi:GreA/GreB family elongation factor [Polaribacter sp. R2A056_3_33]|uniref:GreA/GreB family elongation factor n=1 Tax=Polaribacter sp. R2A056_3_33 TaxID=2745563 RepID=UPI001C4E5274|nr:GreA/GreB family elongation factor [Polaribacter sp. R2A056_3_33]QXP70517.1 GreA/GreB family elongation factor [Polaribacter sp. R2A056_3_33]
MKKVGRYIYALAIDGLERMYVKCGFSIELNFEIMKYDQLIIEENEFLIIEKLLNLNKVVESKTVKSHIFKLQEELRNVTKVVTEKEIPADVVRLNSLVTVRSLDGLWEKTFELVVPSKGNVLQNRISLLLPMGTAVLGYAKGDLILWDFPGGLKELKVLEVMQPESITK